MHSVASCRYAGVFFYDGLDSDFPPELEDPLESDLLEEELVAVPESEEELELVSDDSPFLAFAPGDEPDPFA